jgi:hypothetical protein
MDISSSVQPPDPIQIPVLPNNNVGNDGGCNVISDDSCYCFFVQSGHPLLTSLLGHVHRWMLNKLVKWSLEECSIVVLRHDVRDNQVHHGKVCVSSGACHPSRRDHCFYCRSAGDLRYALQRYPPRILAKTLKSKIVEHMVEVWNILHILLPLVNLGRVEEHDLQSYLQLLGMIEKSCHWELAEADNEDWNATSIKILPQEREPKFKELRGFNVNSGRFPGFAKFVHPLVDGPHSNKAKAKRNSELQAKWKCDRATFDS